MKWFTLVLALAIGALSAQPAAAAAAKSKTKAKSKSSSDIGFKSIGVGLAYVSPEDLGGTAGFGVYADLGRVTPEIAIEPYLGYWSSSEEAFGASASIRDIAVGAHGKYYFEVANPQFRPFAGAGLGFHFLKAEATVAIPGFPSMTSEASETKLGFDFGGGFETSLNPKVDLQGALWYGIVDSASQFSMRIGLSHKL